jgi:hypothetical protein
MPHFVLFQQPCLSFMWLPACLQVLGLTNYSTWPKAAEMRSCMLQHRDIAGGVLEKARGAPFWVQSDITLSQSTSTAQVVPACTAQGVIATPPLK